MKKRLIGAIVLIALAVIFLPMLVKGPAQDNGASSVSTTVPSAPGGDFETRELPLVTPGSPSGNGAVGMNNSAPATVAPQTNPDAADTTAAGPETAAGNYVVSFGAYATASDADTVVARLKESNLPGYREEAMVNGRQAWRVRVGPYGNQALAEAARLQAVKVRSDVNAQVIALDAPKPVQTPTASTPATPATPAAATPATTTPVVATPATRSQPAPASTPAASTTPTTAAPAATPPAATPAATPAAPTPAAAPAASASDVGFAVQLGAFSSGTEAGTLRDKVRDAGFSAFVEQVRTDNGTLNRVRVGPYSSRAEAERMKALIAMKVGVDGMVRQHP